MGNTVVVALYKFVTLEDYRELREPLLQCMLDNQVRGTLLLAEEGINGTVAGSRAGVDALLGWMRADPRLADLDWKESFCDKPPFLRTKVKLKREIVTLGVEGISPTRRVGSYVEPADWNALISDPDVLLIDTRNDYEVRIGSFRGAIDPQTQSFREFPDYVREHCDPARQRKVAMFCTGGIRCEKASSYMLEQGFDEVYHLKGGVLAYLEQVPEAQSLWQGECFVFDERVTVNHDLTQGSHVMCHACGQPVSAGQQQSALYRQGLSCPHCHDRLPEKTRQRVQERQQQIELARQRNQPRPLGPGSGEASSAD